jgi:hypothetical protein
LAPALRQSRETKKSADSPSGRDGVFALPDRCGNGEGGPEVENEVVFVLHNSNYPLFQNVDIQIVDDQMVHIQIVNDQMVDIEIVDDQMVDIQIVDDQMVDIQIVDDQMVNIQIVNNQMVDIQIVDDQMVDIHTVDTYECQLQRQG